MLVGIYNWMPTETKRANRFSYLLFLQKIYGCLNGLIYQSINALMHGYINALSDYDTIDRKKPANNKVQLKYAAF